MQQSTDKNFNQIEALLTRYGFEIKQNAIGELLEKWTASYSVYWIRLAIVEALYQGRYKAISVEHILELWKRLGHPTYHFTYEFERFITRNLLIKEVVSQKVMEKQPQQQPSTSEQPEDTHQKNTVTLTPIQELVKKIAIPVSIPEEKLSTNTDKKESRDNSVAQENVNLADHKNKKERERERQEEKLQLDSQTFPAKEHQPRSIHQFVPHCDASDFYGKLRAVAHQELRD